MPSNYSTTLTINGTELIILAANLNSNSDIPELRNLIKPVFQKLAPFFKSERQVIYLRDIAMGTIDGKYPGGNAYMPEESRIAVPGWPVDERHLRAVLAHELHHIARWQNAGYGKTLGGAMLSEGIAMYFEELETGWTPPWTQVEVSVDAWSAILSDWVNEHYNHYGWFYASPYGKWVAYAAGYLLAKEYFANGFDLERSVMITSSDVRPLADKIKENSRIEKA